MEIMAIVVFVLVLSHLSLNSKVKHLQQLLDQNLPSDLGPKINRLQELLDDEGVLEAIEAIADEHSRDDTIDEDDESEILNALLGLPEPEDFDENTFPATVSVKEVAARFGKSEIKIVEIYIHYLQRRIEYVASLVDKGNTTT